MFKRRLGYSGQRPCAYGHNCPQILETTDGDFVAIGQDVTIETNKEILPGPGIGPLERAVRIPRHVLIDARADIPVST